MLTPDWEVQALGWGLWGWLSFGLVIVWDSLLTSWECSKAVCVCVRVRVCVKERRVSQDLCWRLLAKSLILMLGFYRALTLTLIPTRVLHAPTRVVDRSSGCGRPYAIITGTSRACWGLFFRVVNTRCCLLSLNILFVSCISLKCMTERCLPHPSACCQGESTCRRTWIWRQVPGSLFSSLIYDYVIEKWWYSVVRQNMCGHRVQPRLCWLLFCFHWKMTWTDHS